MTWDTQAERGRQMRSLLVLALLLLAGPVTGQTNEQRLTDLEKSMANLEATQKRMMVELALIRFGNEPTKLASAPVPQRATTDSAESFDAAYMRALAEDKPLLVWVGGNFCPD